MAKNSGKLNNAPKSAAKKPIIAALSVLCVLIVLITGFMAVKDSFYYSVAQNKVLDNDFESATKWAEKSGKVEAKLLFEYIKLRTEINALYPELLTEFDYETVKGWGSRAKLILEGFANCPDIDSSIGENLTSLCSTLENITGVIDGYYEIKPTVYSLMDLFAEYGRLYTKDEQGLNIVFTVSEETQKLDGWDRQNEALVQFAAGFEEGGEVYLLNYLIQEARGESSLLRTAFTESGYAVEEKVRLEGDNTRTVSTVQNGSETLSLLEKERYESFMFAEICKALVENIGEFFIV